MKSFPGKFHLPKNILLLVGLVWLAGTLVAYCQVSQPYQSLHGGNYLKDKNVYSPDPLINYVWDSPSASDSLQIYYLNPEKINFYPPQSFNQIKDSTILISGKGEIMLDFGRVSAGWLEFESDDLSGEVEMSISEYNEPAVLNTGAQNPVKTKRPVKYGNVYRLELNDYLYEGVRFGWIHIKNFSKPWHIKNIRLVCQIKPTNYEGSFISNDSTLNQIWYTGAYTVKLNLLQEYFGAILMERSDRHSWTGDAYPAQAASLVAFGNYDFVKKNIVFTSKQDNGIASYSIYWVLGLLDYYLYSGDKDFLLSFIDNANNRLENAYNHYDNLPDLHFMGWDERLGAGFENPNILEAQNTYKMLCLHAWTKFSKVLAAVGKHALANKYDGYVSEKYNELESNDRLVGQFGVHAISEVVNAGLLDLESVASMSDKLFSNRLNRLSYSPFNQTFIIQAMAKAGKKDVALQTIKDSWGGQLEYGGTTFFEVYRPSWNTILGNNDAPPNNQCGYTSFTHPWGAGVTQWLTENVLGIKPNQAGFKSFTVFPFLSDAIYQLKGSLPTPHGKIEASFDLKSGNGHLIVPPNTKADEVVIPKLGNRLKSIGMNGKELWSHNTKTLKEKRDIEQDKSFVYLKNLYTGTYNLQLKYTDLSESTSSKEEGYNYEIESFVQDSMTSGDWKGKYGKHGFRLLGKPIDVQDGELPNYIDSIQTTQNITVNWNGSDSRNLELKGNGTKGRHSSAMITRDPQPTGQSMTIDVHANKKSSYKVSLYFLDWDRKKRRSAVEVFDLNNLTLSGPVQLIKNYEKGKYLSFMAEGPIRIRINQVRGENAAVSGIFFDSTD
ncbi:alpha-L-rhamnosidase C-terminal domain-containing protein [Flagellimonas amoyensis]|uniref:alpha-L-rhamnosidase-related protein n=1 Tax=Flagellimonas amoyensis TaxID=2169401 RepID=UPI00131F2A92|nr:alpha-L-rhamnosidase C-terminal domain-containing protein [Allomuricauda amoyensis]